MTDERVHAFEEKLQGPNPLSPHVVQFDVSMAHKFLSDRTFDARATEYSLPPLALDSGDEDVKAVLELNRRRIDDIWASVGGNSIEGFQKLALWTMRHYNYTGAGCPTVAMACAALVYGDRQLSRWLLAEYEETRVLYVPHGVDSYTRSPSGEIRSDIASLLSMLEQHRQ